MRRPTFLLFLSSIALLAACSSALDVGSTGGSGQPDDPAAGNPPGSATPGAATPQAPCAAGNGAEVLLATEPGRSIDGLTVDGDDVYYAALPASGTGDSPIMRVSLSGGAAVEVGRTPRPLFLAVSGKWIYVTPAGNSHYELLRLEKAGGGAIETLPLDPGESPVKVVADGNGGIVYAGLRSTAGVAPLVRVAADGTRTKLGASMPSSVLADAMVAEGSAIFWAPEPVSATGPGDGALYATDPADGASRTIFGPDPGKPVFSVVTDATYVYFTHDSAIRRWPKAGGAATSFAADPGIANLAADAKSLYFTTSGTYDSVTNTMQHVTLGRIATTGASPSAETLRTELTWPAKLAVARCDVVYSTLDPDNKSSLFRRSK